MMAICLIAIVGLVAFLLLGVFTFMIAILAIFVPLIKITAFVAFVYLLWKIITN